MQPAVGLVHSLAPASTAFATDSNRPQLLWQPPVSPPTARLTASGAASQVPSLTLVLRPLLHCQTGSSIPAVSMARLNPHPSATPSEIATDGGLIGACIVICGVGSTPIKIPIIRVDAMIHLTQTLPRRTSHSWQTCVAQCPGGAGCVFGRSGGQVGDAAPLDPRPAGVRRYCTGGAVQPLGNPIRQSVHSGCRMAPPVVRAFYPLPHPPAYPPGSALREGEWRGALLVVV